jgi:signal transduction histidine kinase
MHSDPSALSNGAQANLRARGPKVDRGSDVVASSASVGHALLDSLAAGAPQPLGSVLDVEDNPAKHRLSERAPERRPSIALTPAGADEPDGLYRCRILVVDDQPANVLVLERLLRHTGWEDVVSTTDPAEGLDRAESFAPDLILLDLHMPGIDGYEFMERIARRNGSRLPAKVIVLTADTNRAAREHALTLGAADFLTKPFDLLEVVLRIRNHLATHLLQVDLRRRNDGLERRVAERTSELRATLDQLRQAHDTRRELLARLVSAQEEERRRLAAEIHDDTIQTAVAIGIRLELLARHLADADDRAELERLRELVGQGLTGLRNLLIDLRPMALERQGIGEALREYVERWTTDGGPTFELEDRATAEPPLEVRTILFRIAQEALVNARKHAQASTIRIAIGESDGGFLLTVQDDGQGFDLAGSNAAVPGHLGLASMHERAAQAGGWCRVESLPGAGTTVRSWIPVPEEDGPSPEAISGAAAA